MVTSPTGEKFKVTGPDGATDEQVLSQVSAYKPPVAPKAAAAPPTRGGVAPSDVGGDLGFVGGNLSKGVAALAGLPVDTTRNIANLGIAAYGFGTGRGGAAPEPLQGGVGSSDWIQGLMRRGGMIPPSAEPTSKAGEYGAAALQMAPGAFAGRPTNLPMAVRAGSAAALGGLTGQAAADIGGEEWRGIGAMAPGARKMQPKSAGETAAIQRQGEAFGKAKEMGIPIPPRAMKIDKPQLAIQDQINAELRQPPGTEISPKTLQTYRNEHWKNYEALINAPELKGGILPNAKFRDSIREIATETNAASGQFPKTFESMKGVTKLLSDYQQGAPMEPKIIVRAIKKLRSDATTNLQSDKPEQLELGRAQRKIAGSLETLIEDNLAKTPNKALLGAYREARTAIAKSHDVESSLDPVTRQVSGEKLSALMTEGRPLSGRLGKLAEVSGQFPSAMREPSEESMFAKRMSPYGMTHPGAVGAHLATRWHDMPSITNRAPYQSLFVDPRNRLSTEQERAMRYVMGAMGSNRQQDIPPVPQ